MCIRLRRIRAKTQLSRLVNGRYQGLWNCGKPRRGLLPPRPIPGRPAAGQLADRSVRRCRSQANMPGGFTARSVRHRTPTPVVSAIGEAAIALQLMPGYLQAPDRGGHPLRWRRIIAGQSSALKVGTAGQLADFCPWLGRAP